MIISKYIGSYDLCHPKEKQYYVVICWPEGGKIIDESWPEEDEPEIRDLPPSEVIELIAERLESYWISTRREENREIIAWCREYAEYLDTLWAQEQIDMLSKKISKNHKRMEDLKRFYL
jgi:hypothetical protein